MFSHTCGNCNSSSPLMPTQQFETASVAVQKAWLAAVAKYGLEYTWCVPCIAQQDWGHTLKYGVGVANCSRWDYGRVDGHSNMGVHLY